MTFLVTIIMILIMMIMIMMMMIIKIIIGGHRGLIFMHLLKVYARSKTTGIYEVYEIFITGKKRIA